MLNELAKEVHETALSKGWWDKSRSPGECIALMHSELSEALEEIREQRHVISYTEEGKPIGLPIELADCIIRILDFCEFSWIDIDKAMQVKMEYNKSRPYRHGGKAL